MAFERRHELWTFDIFPKVMAAGKEKSYISGRLVTDYFSQSATSIPQF